MPSEDVGPEPDLLHRQEDLGRFHGGVPGSAALEQVAHRDRGDRGGGGDELGGGCAHGVVLVAPVGSYLGDI
jgi:hypothetical protein